MRKLVDISGRGDILIAAIDYDYKFPSNKWESKYNGTPIRIHVNSIRFTKPIECISPEDLFRIREEIQRLTDGYAKHCWIKELFIQEIESRFA